MDASTSCSSSLRGLSTTLACQGNRSLLEDLWDWMLRVPPLGMLLDTCVAVNNPVSIARVGFE